MVKLSCMWVNDGFGYTNVTPPGFVRACWLSPARVDPWDKVADGTYKYVPTLMKMEAAAKLCQRESMFAMLDFENAVQPDGKGGYRPVGNGEIGRLTGAFAKESGPLVTVGIPLGIGELTLTREDNNRFNTADHLSLANEWNARYQTQMYADALIADARLLGPKWIDRDLEYIHSLRRNHHQFAKNRLFVLLVEGVWQPGPNNDWNAPHAVIPADIANHYVREIERVKPDAVLCWGIDTDNATLVSAMSA